MPKSIGQKKILVIDDQMSFTELVRARLEPQHKVSVAFDGEEGLQKAFYEKPDLIFADLLMPKLDGYELLKKLKAHVRTQEIPVVIVTAVSETNSIYRAQGLGVADYLIKPFSVEELPDFVKRYA